MQQRPPHLKDTGEPLLGVAGHRPMDDRRQLGREVGAPTRDRHWLGLQDHQDLLVEPTREVVGAGIGQELVQRGRRRVLVDGRPRLAHRWTTCSGAMNANVPARSPSTVRPLIREV